MDGPQRGPGHCLDVQPFQGQLGAVLLQTTLQVAPLCDKTSSRAFCLKRVRHRALANSAPVPFKIHVQTLWRGLCAIKSRCSGHEHKILSVLG